MKTFFKITLFVAIFSSCAPQTLYYWGNYENTTYSYLKNANEQSIEALIENYKKIMENPKGTRRIIPPGVCADYGFLLLQDGKTQEGKELLMKELALYPESKIFIDRILKMIEE